MCGTKIDWVTTVDENSELDGYLITFIAARAATEANTDPESGDVTTPATDATPATFTVGNTPGAALPSTGGPGTSMFYVFGSIITLLAAVLLITKRRSGSAE